MDTRADMSPLLGLVFQAFYYVSLCGRILAAHCFCISSLADDARNWKMTKKFSPSCFSYLCNEMSHFNTKFSFLANKQDSIPPVTEGISIVQFCAVTNLRVQWKMNFCTSTSSPIHLLWFLVCLHLTIWEKKGWRRVFFTSAVFRAKQKEGTRL